jgi:hypothetical protein
MTEQMTEKELDRLSRDHLRKKKAYEEARDRLAEAIPAAAAAGIRQVKIVEITTYTREAVRQMCMTPEQREAEREKRRERTRVKPSTK